MRKGTNKKIEIANLFSSNIILTHLFILLKKLNQYPRLLTPKSILLMGKKKKESKKEIYLHLNLSRQSWNDITVKFQQQLMTKPLNI